MQKAAFDFETCLEFRRVVFRSLADVVQQTAEEHLAGHFEARREPARDDAGAQTVVHDLPPGWTEIGRPPCRGTAALRPAASAADETEHRAWTRAKDPEGAPAHS